jgi:hypothetical protein
MSLLSKENKKSIGSVYENFISKYRDKISARANGGLDVNYDGKEISISGLGKDISAYFYFSTLYDMRDELNREIIINSDVDLNIVADRDALATKRIKLKADKNINILPHINSIDNSILITIYNIDIIANEICLSGRYTQLHNAFIKTDTLQVYNCPTMSFERIISGYINANSVEFKMYEFNDWNKTLKKLVTSSIKYAIEAFDVNKSQLELMKEIDPIQKLGLSEYNTNEFKFSFGKLEFILTRNANIPHTYQLANGWYLIYTKL